VGNGKQPAANLARNQDSEAKQRGYGKSPQQRKPEPAAVKCFCRMLLLFFAAARICDPGAWLIRAAAPALASTGDIPCSFFVHLLRLY
jgi:hypothetical protein